MRGGWGLSIVRPINAYFWRQDQSASRPLRSGPLPLPPCGPEHGLRIDWPVVVICRPANATMAEAIEASILRSLNDNGQVADTGDFATSTGVDHLAVVGVMKSLQVAEMVVVEVRRALRR